MPETRLALSGYRPVWLFAMFDLPVKTQAQRRRYAQFRKVVDRGRGGNHSGGVK